MKEFKVISLYFFLIVNLFSGLHLEAKSIVSGDIVEGQAYQPNFLKQKGHFEKNANGTTAYADAAGTRPVDGSGGTPTLSCTRTTSSPIDGDGSLLITKDAANRQGQGCTIQFTIDSAYKAKVLQIEFDYLVASGTFTAGSSSADSDLIVYIYDVTNSTLIEPSSIKLLSNSSTISDHFVANFQTSATGTTYNLILHQATTSASAYTVKADNFEVKPSKYVYGTPISDWQSYTPTITGFGTPSNVSFVYRRVGDSYDIRGFFTSGTSTAVTASVSLPNSAVASSTKLPSGFTYVGGVGALSTTGDIIVTQVIGGSSNITFGRQGSASTGLNQFNGSQVASSTQNVSFEVLGIAITGLSSSTQVSDGYDGRQIVFVGKNSAATSIATTGTYVPFTSQKDSTASWYTDTFTCPSYGDYEVKAGLHGSSASNYLYAQVDKNGTLYARILQNESRGDRLASGSVIVYNCSAGETIKLKAYSDTSSQTLNASADLNFITISKLSSPQTMSATAKTVFDASDASGTIISTGATGSLVSFGTVVTNTHGNYSSGIFTAQEQGDYTVEGMIQFSANSTGYRGLKVLKNNTDYRYIGLNGTPSATNGCAVSGATNVYLNAGDTLKIYAEQNSGGNLALVASGLSNYIVISKKK